MSISDAFLAILNYLCAAKKPVVLCPDYLPCYYR